MAKDLRGIEKYLTLNMLERDILVRMEPQKKYSIKLKIKSIKKAIPKIVGPMDLDLK